MLRKFCAFIFLSVIVFNVLLPTIDSYINLGDEQVVITSEQEPTNDLNQWIDVDSEDMELELVYFNVADIMLVKPTIKKNLPFTTYLKLGRTSKKFLPPPEAS